MCERRCGYPFEALVAQTNGFRGLLKRLKRTSRDVAKGVSSSAVLRAVKADPDSLLRRLDESSRVTNRMLYDKAKWKMEQMCKQTAQAQMLCAAQALVS